MRSIGNLQILLCAGNPAGSKAPSAPVCSASELSEAVQFRRSKSSSALAFAALTRALDSFAVAECHRRNVHSQKKDPASAIGEHTASHRRKVEELRAYRPAPARSRAAHLTRTLCGTCVGRKLGEKHVDRCLGKWRGSMRRWLMPVWSSLSTEMLSVRKCCTTATS